MSDSRPAAAVATFIRAARELIPPRGIIRSLAMQTVVYAIGSGIFMAGNAVFFTRVVGLSSVQVGTGLSIAGFVSLMSSVPLGRLIDKLGPKKAWVTGTVLEATLFALYPVIHGFAAYLAVVSVLAFVQAANSISLQSYSLSAVAKGQRVRSLAYQRSALNVGFTLGGLLAGLALIIDTPASYRSMVFVTAGMLFLTSVFIGRLPSLETVVPRTATGRGSILRDGPFLVVSMLSGALHAHATVFLLALPLWTIKATDAPSYLVAALFVTNTVLAVLIQVAASGEAETVSGAGRVLSRSGFITAGACLVFASAALTSGWITIGVLLAGTVILTIGEVTQAAGAWGTAAALSPSDRRSEYLGKFRLGNQIERMVGPTLITALVFGTGGWGWLLVAGGFVLAGLLARPAVSRAERFMRHPDASEQIPTATAS